MEKVKGAFYFVSILLFSSQLNAGSTSPSQTVPKVLEEIEKDKIKNLGNQNFLNGLGNTDAEQADLEQISVLVNSIVIIASKELQNVIKFDKYKKELIGKLKSITDLNLIAREMSKDFQSQGLPLVRVILPKQELKPKGATVFFKVIDGFVEKIDLQKVPRMQRKAIFRYLRELKNKKSIKNSLLERKLLLASQVVGLKLNTAFAPGPSEGGTILIVEAKHKLVSGSVQFNNTQSEELGRQLGVLQSTINSPFGYGEGLTMFGLARPTIKGMKGTGNSVTIRGGGLSFSYPLGDNGLMTNLSYSESMTRPGGDIVSLGIESNMKSGSFGLSYPLILKASSSWTLRGNITWIDELQQTNTTGIDQVLSHDRLTSLRLGLSYYGCPRGCFYFDTEVSRGIDIASRSASEATDIPLSRTSGTSQYHHLRINSSYSFYVLSNYLMKIGFGGQYTDDALLNSEQDSVVGMDRISALTSGAISGDKIWYVRGELNRNFLLFNKLSITPYLYSAMGVAYLNRPTAAENKENAAKSVGVGLQLNNFNDYFYFDKNITAKVEYSKTIATDKIEILSDVRLNKHHLMLMLNMNF
jgi:hemolysin activation/secretion protein